MTKMQLNKIKKMKDYLERLFDTGKIPKTCSQYDLTVAYSNLEEVYSKGSTEVISAEICKLFKKFGFNVRECGIGWIISA